MGGILRALPHVPHRYLDIGCGTGRYLRYMEQRGLERANIYGLELDDEVVKPLADDGYQAFSRRVEDFDAVPPNSLDLVTMFHVIEHVDDPSAIFERVARWLSAGGVFAIETPNIDCFAARIFKKTFWGGYHIPRHWNLFSAGTLTRLCEAAGLEVIKVKYQPGHSFWMYSLHHALRYGKRPRPRLATVLFDPFRGFLPFLVMFTVLDKVRAMVGARTGAMLMLARKPARAS
jgi:SAM-dependent methyltransferase